MSPILDTTVELSAQEDCFLRDIDHLILEFKMGQSTDKVNLLSRRPSAGVWDADNILGLPDMAMEFMVSVFMELGQEERQLVSFIELNQPALYDALGNRLEIPLMCHESYPNMVLKTKVEAMSVDDLQRLVQESSQQRESRYGEHVVGNPTDTNTVITRLQAALDRTPDGHPERVDRLYALGGALLARFEDMGNLSDIDNALSRLLAAVDLTPDNDPVKPTRLNTLGSCFGIRFQRLGGIEDINKAIIYQQAAVDLTSDYHPNKPMYLGNLGSSFALRFQRFGNLADVDSAIVQQKAAVELASDDDSGKLMYLSNLGSCYGLRFQHLGNIADADNGIAQQRAAIKLILDGDPDKPIFLTNLGTSYLTRFERFGNLEDIDSAIDTQKVAIKLLPDGDPLKPAFLNNLGSALLSRFERLGGLADVDDTIAQQQAAIILTPDDHTEKPERLVTLGKAFLARFRLLGNLKDINSAIEQQQKAVDLTPNGHPELPSHLNNLANSHRTRFERLQELVDIDKSISYHQMAVDITSKDRPNRLLYLHNLGNAFMTRSHYLGNLADIDNAIKQQRESVNLTPDSHLNKPLYLNGLVNSLLLRFERLGNLEDINEAITQQQIAVKITPDGHPNKSGYLNNFGNCHWARFLRSHEPHDAEAAISQYSASAMSSVGPTSIRFQAANRWIYIASTTGHSSLLDAYECALAIMPLVAWLGLPITDRHQRLTEIGATVRDAAAAAISLEQYDKALEWLEQGRSIVWNQILQLRTPVDRLRDVDPDLADRLLQVSRQLDHGVEQKGLPGDNIRSIEEEERRYRALTTEWEAIVERVRSLPEFEDFLRPPSVSRLMDAARDGPVVVLNIAKKRCDALALVAGFDDTIHIPLPNISHKKVIQLRDDLKDLLSSSGIRMRELRAAKRETDEDEDEESSCKLILADLWNDIVKPVLDSLAFFPHPDTFPRIWWCATGPLAFLPIHAAGIYDPNSVDSQISEYVISSYTPTLSALLGGSTATEGSTFNLLSVIEASAPGASHIPNTKEELEHIRSRLIGRDHHVLEGPEATKGRVTKAMEDSNWLHLACHGVQDPVEPTKSALLLRDGGLTLEEIIKLSLPKAEFAFLSACQTTAGDEKLSEEAVHIAGGMQLAGYHSVVATMWSIQDEIAPEVTDAFYAHIMQDKGRPDSRKAAEALHFSVQKLREKKRIPLTTWIPFVHLGI